MSIRALIVDLTTQDTYPATPQLDAGFEGQVTVFNECSDVGSYIYVSFDGTTANEVRLRPSSPSQALAFSAKYRKVWVRRLAGVLPGTLAAQVILEGT